MTFKRITKSNLEVPGKMDMDEMAFLAALAARVPEGGHIIEVGPFYGRSTNAMARANPGAKITSIDTFEDVEWTERYAGQYNEIPKFGREAFDHFTAELPNVTAIQGFSPDVVSDWSDPIDMYFEDAIHGNPGLKANMDFWIERLKPGGIACGHDYSLRFPDIKSEALGWAKTWGTKVEVVGSLWALRKPIPGEDPALSAAGLAPILTDQPRLKIRVANKKRGADKASDNYWCGAHLEADRLSWISIDPIDAETGLKLEYRVGSSAHGAGDWTPAGQKARLIKAGKDLPFTRIAVRVSASDGRPAPHVIYRVSARQIGNGGFKRSGVSRWAMDGDWASFHREGAAINAVTIALTDELPSDVQAAFTPSLPVNRDTIRARVKQLLWPSVRRRA